MCEKVGDEPIDWKADDNVQYIKVGDLRKAFEANKVIQERPKGAEEGFETRLTWPCSVASSDGIVIEISNRIKFKRKFDNQTISLSLIKKGIELKPCVLVGEEIKKYQIIASVTPVLKKIPKKEISLEDYYRNLIKSTSIADRYSAAKAFSFFK